MLETELKPTNEREAIALALLDGMGPDIESFTATFRKNLTDDAVWEAVGMPPRVGKAACLAYIDALHEKTGITYCTIRVLSMASNDTKVFTERDDLIMRPNGEVAISARVCGVIEVRGTKISRYTDYVDLSQMAHAKDPQST